MRCGEVRALIRKVRPEGTLPTAVPASDKLGERGARLTTLTLPPAVSRKLSRARELVCPVTCNGSGCSKPNPASERDFTAKHRDTPARPSRTPSLQSQNSGSRRLLGALRPHGASGAENSSRRITGRPRIRSQIEHWSRLMSAQQLPMPGHQDSRVNWVARIIESACPRYCL